MFFDGALEGGFRGTKGTNTFDCDGRETCTGVRAGVQECFWVNGVDSAAFEADVTAPGEHVACVGTFVGWVGVVLMRRVGARLGSVRGHGAGGVVDGEGLLGVFEVILLTSRRDVGMVWVKEQFRAQAYRIQPSYISKKSWSSDNALYLTILRFFVSQEEKPCCRYTPISLFGSTETFAFFVTHPN